MNYSWILVATALGVVGAMPNRHGERAEQLMQILSNNKELGRNSAIENIIIGAFDDLREVMLTGTDAIPVLDPFQLERVYVDDDTFPGANIELNNLVVSKLATFVINDVNVNLESLLLQRYRIKLDGEVPVIDVEVGSYDLLVNVMGLGVFGKGNAKISIVKPRIKLDMLTNIRLGLGSVYLNILQLRIDFELEDFKPAINGLLGEPTVDNFINIFLRNLVMEFVEFFWDDISDILSPAVMSVANDILRDLNLIDLL